MAKNLFSVPIFFVVFREALEAAIIVSVLIGLVKQVVSDLSPVPPSTDTESGSEKSPSDTTPVDDALWRKRLLRRLNLQIYAGSAIGFFIALAIGGAFLGVWFTRASDLWAKSEEIWEGIFQLIASLMIFVMGISMLKLDTAKVKWRVKLQHALQGQSDRSTKTGKWVLFILPFVTVLREGLEGVIFVGGVSLGQPASSIPIAVIVGILCGFLIGVLIYQCASRTTMSIFLVIMANLLLLIGAGLFTKSVAAFERHRFNLLLGADLDDAGGDGPGSYDVRGNVWHLACCNPGNSFSGQGWGIFWSILGWSNNADIGTILSYVFYWIAVIVVLVVMKFKEGRTKIFGFESAAGRRRRARA